MVASVAWNFAGYRSSNAMRLDTLGRHQRFFPAATPFGMVGQYALRVFAAAHDKLRVERPAGRRSGRLIAQVKAPTDMIAIVRNRTMGRVAVHEHNAA